MWPGCGNATNTTVAKTVNDLKKSYEDAGCPTFKMKCPVTGAVFCKQGLCTLKEP
jgi:hypothetical protein